MSFQEGANNKPLKDIVSFWRLFVFFGNPRLFSSISRESGGFGNEMSEVQFL